MSATQTTTSPIYKLGRVSFLVDNCDDKFLDDLHQLLPLDAAAKHDDPKLVEVKMGCVQDVRGLINNILKRHNRCLWIDAGCLVSPDGFKLLIAGASGAGKSTTTMALAIGLGWKVIAEDILLIDLEKNSLISFSSPFSLKAGTKELLKSTLGKNVEEDLIQTEWLPLRTLAFEGETSANFDASLIFDRRNPEVLEIDEVPPATYLRRILPISNILRLPDSSEKLLEYISSGVCRQFNGGTLQQRLDEIQKMARSKK